jgi:hypothetical protein
MVALVQVSGVAVGVGGGEADAVGVAGCVVGATDAVPQAVRTAIIATTASALDVMLRMPIIRAQPPKRDGGIVMRVIRGTGSR